MKSINEMSQIQMVDQNMTTIQPDTKSKLGHLSTQNSQKSAILNRSQARPKQRPRGGDMHDQNERLCMTMSEEERKHKKRVDTELLKLKKKLK